MEEHGRDGLGVSEGPAPSCPEADGGANQDLSRDLNEVLRLGQINSMGGSPNIGRNIERNIESEEPERESGPLRAEIEALQNENETLKTEAEDLKNQLAAARADLYNYRQRTERERTRTLRSLTLDRIGDFLPVLDNLDRALSVPEDGTARDVLIGVRMVQRQFLSILEDAGVTPVSTEGHPFDPAIHDAIETEAVGEPGQDGVILRELSRGYRSAERVLRVAQVRVGRFEAKEAEADTETFCQ
jgi:molecular chaperone GrpE